MTSPKVYRVEVAEYWTEHPDTYFSGWECWGNLTYEDACDMVERIMGRKEDEDGPWINDNDEFEADYFFSLMKIRLPVRVTIRFVPSVFVYRTGKPFGLVKEEIIHKHNHYALEDAVL
jgi:hypothetical protein